jgi:hypothetical protein
MLQLLHALQDEGIDHWRVVARAWNVELPGRDPLDALLRAMLDPARVADAFDCLPDESRAALEALRQSGGRIPMAAFTHRYGELRAMGPARRQREQPWRDPVSITERLWYGGWIGRAFIRTGGASQEYAYLPADLEALLPAGTAAENGQRLLSYLPAKEERIQSAGNRAAQDACSLLAFLRMRPQPVGRSPQRWPGREMLARHLFQPESVELLVFLLREQGLISGDPLQPDPKKAPAFLERTDRDAAEDLRRAWESSAWNEMERSGEWTVEGNWPNDPVAARRHFLDALQWAPTGAWCTLDSLVVALRQTSWEFLRPSSSFEEWLIRDRKGEFLRGLDSWEQVEGTLARYLVTKPMAWLGLVDLAPAGDPRAFRRIVREEGRDATPAQRTRGTRIRVDGTVLAATDVPRILRYRLARCAEWVGRTGDVFVYRITPRSLVGAREQNIRSGHILQLLKELGGEMPAALGTAIRRWEQCGAETGVARERILLPRTPESAARIAARLEGNRSMIRRIEGPAWIVNSTSLRRVRELLAQDGMLIDEEEET